MNDYSQPDADKPDGANDPFDPAHLRLSPDLAAGAIGVKQRFTTIKVAKPNKQEFIRVHPAEEYRIDTTMIEDKINLEIYLVSPALRRDLPDLIQPVRFCFSVTRHGLPFLWPAKLPDPNGRQMDWYTSMLEAQAIAIKSWVRVQADKSAGSYAVFQAVRKLPEPNWPELTFSEVLRLAFQNRFIDSLDHPYIRELLGDA